MTDYREIEIKVRVSETTRLLDFLQSKAKFVREQREVDEYFNPPHRDFLDHRPVEEWLRLRQADGRNSINYKRWHYDTAGKISLYADEYETPVADLTNLRKLFAALDFRPLITVDKHRRTWHYRDYEIVLDSVKNLGDFIEIEHKGQPDADPKTVTDGMIAFLKDIGCGTIERSFLGYPMMLLHPGEMRLETV